MEGQGNTCINQHPTESVCGIVGLQIRGEFLEGWGVLSSAVWIMRLTTTDCVRISGFWVVWPIPLATSLGLYTVSQKNCATFIFYCNFGKCWSNKSGTFFWLTVYIPVDFRRSVVPSPTVSPHFQTLATPLYFYYFITNSVNARTSA